MSNLQVALKPLGRELRNFFQRARFFEQVGRPGNDLQFLLALEPRECLTVEADDDIIVTANNQEGGGVNFRQRVAGEVRPPAPGDDRLDLPFQFGGGNQRRSRARTRAEKAEFKICDLVSVGGPSRRFSEPACEHPDVEPEMPCEIFLLFFTRREQVKQQRGDASSLQHARDVLVAWASPTAAAPVRKEHEPARLLGRRQIAIEIRSLHWDPDCLWLLHRPVTNLQRAPDECNPPGKTVMSGIDPRSALSADLNYGPLRVTCAQMKFLLAILVWLIMGAVIATGIILAFKGTVWLLLLAVLAFIIMVAKIGCLSH